MANKLNRKLLRERIIAVLPDDEEFLEEIYLDMNFDIEERSDEKGDSVLYYRAYRIHFRLTEIMDELRLMIEEGLITYRVQTEFPESCCHTRNLYRLTTAGELMWEHNIIHRCDRLFK